jgi:hypothetical protein
VNVLEGLLCPHRKALKVARVGQSLDDNLICDVIHNAIDKVIHCKEICRVGVERGRSRDNRDSEDEWVGREEWRVATTVNWMHFFE